MHSITIPHWTGNTNPFRVAVALVIALALALLYVFDRRCRLHVALVPRRNINIRHNINYNFSTHYGQANYFQQTNSSTNSSKTPSNPVSFHKGQSGAITCTHTHTRTHTQLPTHHHHFQRPPSTTSTRRRALAATAPTASSPLAVDAEVGRHRRVCRVACLHKRKRLINDIITNFHNNTEYCATET